MTIDNPIFDSFNFVTLSEDITFMNKNILIETFYKKESVQEVFNLKQLNVCFGFAGKVCGKCL